MKIILGPVPVDEQCEECPAQAEFDGLCRFHAKEEAEYRKYDREGVRI